MEKEVIKIIKDNPDISDNPFKITSLIVRNRLKTKPQLSNREVDNILNEVKNIIKWIT